MDSYRNLYCNWCCDIWINLPITKILLINDYLKFYYILIWVKNMNKISVGMIYTPVNYIKPIELDLTEISDKITKNERFAIERHRDKSTEFYNHDKETKVTIYSNNSLYFKRDLEKSDLSPTQLKLIAKEGLNFAQENTSTTDYSESIGLIIEGNDMKSFYEFGAEKIIENFARELFGEYADCKELKLDDYGFHISVKSTKAPVFEISD